MRDPQRIDKMCDELKELWKEVPDWRLGQLLSNAARRQRTDLFYIEDNDLMQTIIDMLGEMYDD